MISRSRKYEAGCFAGLLLALICSGVSAQTDGAMMMMAPARPTYTKFTSQRELGNFLIDHYKIRKPNELSSCEVCHR